MGDALNTILVFLGHPLCLCVWLITIRWDEEFAATQIVISVHRRISKSALFINLPTSRAGGSDRPYKTYNPVRDDLLHTNSPEIARDSRDPFGLINCCGRKGYTKWPCPHGGTAKHLIRRDLLGVLAGVHGKLTVNHSTMVTSSANAIRTSSHSIWASWWMCLGSDQSQTTKAWIKLIPLFFFGNRVWQRPLLACFLGISSLKNNSAKFIYWITAGEETQDGRGRPATVTSNVMPAWSVKWDGHTRRLWWVAVDSDHILWNVVLSEDGKSIHLNKYSSVNNIHSNYQHQQPWRLYLWWVSEMRRLKTGWASNCFAYIFQRWYHAN